MGRAEASGHGCRGAGTRRAAGVHAASASRTSDGLTFRRYFPERHSARESDAFPRNDNASTISGRLPGRNARQPFVLDVESNDAMERR